VAVPAEFMVIDHRCVEISHPEKILFPEDGIRKHELVEHYRRIAPWILPHLRDGPLAMESYPDGSIGPASSGRTAAA
jgi:bifunctional non-homologous end joining protein LigD